MPNTDDLLVAGDRAPEFELPDANGRPTGLREFAGTRLIVYFYPAAMTPGCTSEARDFGDAGPHLAAADVRVVGISRDPQEKLAEFAAREGITFPLLSDVDRAVHRRYGVLGTKVVDGAHVEKVRRSTFVIGPDGRIERAMYDVNVDGHAEEVVLGLKSG